MYYFFSETQIFDSEIKKGENRILHLFTFANFKVGGKVKRKKYKMLAIEKLKYIGTNDKSL